MSRQPELFEAIHWWLPILLHNVKERCHVLRMTQLITVLNTGTMVDTDGSYSTPQVVIVAMISSLRVFRSFAKDVSNAVTTTSFAMLTGRNTIMGADAFTLPTNLFRPFTSATVPFFLWFLDCFAHAYASCGNKWLTGQRTCASSLANSVFG